MKIATMILGILGGVAAAGLGFKWMSDINANAAILQMAEAMAGNSAEVSQFKSLQTAAYLLIGFGVLSIIAAIMVGKLKKISAGILVIAAVVPAIFAPQSLIFTFLLIIAGILAFFVKDPQAS